MQTKRKRDRTKQKNRELRLGDGQKETENLEIKGEKYL